MPLLLPTLSLWLSNLAGLPSRAGVFYLDARNMTRTRHWNTSARRSKTTGFYGICSGLWHSSRLQWPLLNSIVVWGRSSSRPSGWIKWRGCLFLLEDKHSRHRIRLTWPSIWEIHCFWANWHWDGIRCDSICDWSRCRFSVFILGKEMISGARLCLWYLNPFGALLWLWFWVIFWRLSICSILLNCRKYNALLHRSKHFYLSFPY